MIDAADLAARPRPSLEALCAALRIPFDEAMLSWPAGPRPTDGVWAKHWYARVWASTGFTAPSAARTRARRRCLAALEDLAARCQPFYDELAAHRLVPAI